MRTWRLAWSSCWPPLPAPEPRPRPAPALGFTCERAVDLSLVSSRSTCLSSYARSYQRELALLNDKMTPSVL